MTVDQRGAATYALGGAAAVWEKHKHGHRETFATYNNAQVWACGTHNAFGWARMARFCVLCLAR